MTPKAPYGSDPYFFSACTSICSDLLTSEARLDYILDYLITGSEGLCGPPYKPAFQLLNKKTPSILTHCTERTNEIVEKGKAAWEWEKHTVFVTGHYEQGASIYIGKNLILPAFPDGEMKARWGEGHGSPSVHFIQQQCPCVGHEPADSRV